MNKRGFQSIEFNHNPVNQTGMMVATGDDGTAWMMVVETNGDSTGWHELPSLPQPPIDPAVKEASDRVIAELIKQLGELSDDDHSGMSRLWDAYYDLPYPLKSDEDEFYKLANLRSIRTAYRKLTTARVTDDKVDMGVDDAKD